MKISTATKLFVRSVFKWQNPCKYSEEINPEEPNQWYWENFPWFEVTGIFITDLYGRPADVIKTGMQYNVNVAVKSMKDYEMSCYVLVQLKNPEGVLWLQGGTSAKFNPYEEKTFAVMVTPTEGGRHTAEVYVWYSISEPCALAKVRTMEFDVV